MLMDSLQGQLKTGLAEVIIHWVIWEKLLKKRSVSPNMVMKSPIRLKFCRNMLMDSLQGQLKTGLAEVIFHWVVWVKLLKKALSKS